MKHYEAFKITGETFEERSSVDTFSCAIGRIALNFSNLEDKLEEGIRKMLAVDNTIAEIVSAEISFKQKLYIFSSLIKHLSKTIRFNTGYAETSELLPELIANCFKAEELRNKILHSTWKGFYLAELKAIRQKITSKAKQGHRVTKEEIDSGYLLDVSDFISCVALDVEEFFLVFEKYN